ncbi:MAG: hypothetical protein HYW77_02955 [Parcubacteria group bacterium]|nr:hypothetical protein [Parcubacteria group bacterium]
MKLSKLFTKTLREPPRDEVAVNAKLLEQGGFIFKNSAGVYSFLPLGWRVAQNIINIVKKEMNQIDGQEVFMPALIEKKFMEASGRWEVDIGFKVVSQNELNSKVQDSSFKFQDSFVLGWTHEEVITAIVAKYINSYRDLPFATYQIQTKFRNEPRAKSGLLRGREFMMKDLYSFHVSEEDLLNYYQKVKDAYFKIFNRCDLKSIYTVAAGGDFTLSDTHEFQVLSDVGEDTIAICLKCEYAENSELNRLKAGDACPKCGEPVTFKKSVEVGNIFPLGTKYAEAFNLYFTDHAGNKKPVVMGSYGIGIGRLMATIVELHNDQKGIIWPESVAPFRVQLIVLDDKFDEGNKLYTNLQASGIEVLYDDRHDKTAGERFADADLIGCPVRLVVSEKTLKYDSVEIKKRQESKNELVGLQNIIGML